MHDVYHNLKTKRGIIKIKTFIQRFVDSVVLGHPVFLNPIRTFCAKNYFLLQKLNLNINILMFLLLPL